MYRLVALSTLGLAVAAGGPILYFKSKENWTGFHQDLARQTAAAARLAASKDSGQLPLEGAPVRNLAEVLRFDVTADWVLKRWPRVTVGMSDLQLHGYRVPLVTGTEANDLAGSLTYYFGSDQRVERITFRGTTGNTRELVELLTTRYRFARRLTNDPGLFVYEGLSRKGVRPSVLEFRLSPVVVANDPFHRFDVQLSIERPTS